VLLWLLGGSLKIAMISLGAAATLMLNNGAGIRHVQQMPGHALLTAMQICTQLSIQKL